MASLVEIGPKVMGQISWHDGNMKSDPATPISIPDDIAAKCDGPEQFQKFDRMFRKVLTAKPHHVVKDAPSAPKVARSCKKHS